MGEALWLLKAKWGLLRRGLGAREGEGSAGGVAFLGYRGHRVGARAIHLGIRDCARVDEARGVVHPVLGRLEVHHVRLPVTATGGDGREEGTRVVEGRWVSQGLHVGTFNPPEERPVSKHVDVWVNAT
jgi:hypothetical protein